MLRMEMCPYSSIRWFGCFRCPWLSFIRTDEFSVRVKKLLQGLVSYELTTYVSDLDLFLIQ